MTTLAKAIVADRMRLGLNQDELAKRLGVRQQSISLWERATGAPVIPIKKTLYKMVEVLGTNSEVAKHLGVSPIANVQIIQQNQQDSVIDDLAALLPEDAEVWRAQIRAAAVKARRLKHEESDRRQNKSAVDPPLERRRAS